MSEGLEHLLRLVAVGKLSPEDAAPLVAALGEADGSKPATDDRRTARSLHVEVRDHGRQALNLRVPLALGHSAARMVPGLAPEYVERIREALTVGLVGPILDLLDEDGDGVRISLD